MNKIQLSGVVAEHIRAINASDIDAIIATFAKDALVNDNKREIVGIEAIRKWAENEIIADKVSIEVRDTLDHYGDVVVRGAYAGDFDKAGLPDEIVLTNYFSLRDGKIAGLIIVFNQPSPY
jgi:hypothetical protein